LNDFRSYFKNSYFTLLNRINHFRRIQLSVLVFVIATGILSMVQLKVQKPMLLSERFFPGTGWIQIFFVGLYGALIIYKMYDPKNVSRWRKYSWLLFSIVFFTQLILGISGFETFLMQTGKLHLPVPAMIISGPIYRLQIGFMTILFLSTIILSGPAWCSHLCYFGALDNISASGKTTKGRIKNKHMYKFSIFFIVVFTTLLFKLFNASNLTAVIAGGIFGLVGLFVILVISTKKKKMIHCTTYCPVGTLINYLRIINPFRPVIDDHCNVCGLCTSYCKYDSLNKDDILKKKPAMTCTYCGDCIISCKSGSIQYKFFKLSSNQSRNLWLVVTISIHVLFLSIARL
jgi:ferredoxin-type protein NapH